MSSTELMEDHRDAYFLWKRMGLKDHACLHIDAHLDVSNLKAPANEEAQSPRINCGNFLLPALDENVLSALIWVIPRHLPGEENLLDWTRLELQNWLRLGLTDYMSLEQIGRRVQGTLLGKPFTVCFSQDIPKLDEPHLLDIDIDYYLGANDELWQSPLELAAHLHQARPTVTTIAYSVQGGYTPLRYRYLAPLTQLALDNPESAQQIWSALEDTHNESPSDLFPDWLQATFLARAGRLAEAADIDPGYQVQAIDLVSAALMRENFPLAKSHLELVESKSESLFMQGMIGLRERDYDQALRCWTELLGREALGKDTLIYLLVSCGRAYLEIQSYSEAYDTLVRASKIARNDFEITALLGRVCISLTRYEEAAKFFRRAIKLAPRLLETAEIRLELADLYLLKGQRGLAERLLKQTVSGNTPGFMKLRAEALKLKLALRRDLV